MMASFEEDGRYRTFYQDPVQSSDTGTKDVIRTEQVVSSFQTVNSPSIVTLRQTKSPVVVEEPESHSFKSPEPGSLKSVTREQNSSPIVAEVTIKQTPSPLVDTERQPLLQSNIINGVFEIQSKGGRVSKRQCTLFCLLFATVIIATLTVTIVTVYFEYHTLNNSETTVAIQNENDTIITSQVEAMYCKKVELQLITESIQPLHVVHLYAQPCDKLLSHLVTETSAGNFTLNTATMILLPTYFVAGSQITINGLILNASTITAQIQLYFFKSLDRAGDFADNLEDRIYQATIYISGSGVQNTSTPVNYTVESTDYYFIVVDTTAHIKAEFDIKLHRQIYKPSDYLLTCVIQDSDVCTISYDRSYKEECILAHTVYVPSIAWAPADIKVTSHPRRHTHTAIVAMSTVGGICGFLVAILLIITFSVCLYKCSQCKRTYY